MSGAVLLSLLVGGAVALWNVQRLSRDASAEIESGLTKASEQYLMRDIDMTAQRAGLMFARTFDQVNALAQFGQSLIDQPQLGRSLGTPLESYPGFQDQMTFNSEKNWLQNAPGKPQSSACGATCWTGPDGCGPMSRRRCATRASSISWCHPS